VLGLVLFAYSMPAQSKLDELMTKTTPEERAELQTKNMQEKLSLSEQQFQQVHEINLKYAHRMQRVYQANEGKLQKLKSMKSVSEDKDREMKRVLDPRQYETYREQKDQMKDNVRKRQRERGQ
jgi:hypothetical protein